MQPGRSARSGDGVPVFVIPPSLTFYADDQNSHKQVAILYSMHDSDLKYRVLSNARNKYVVTDAEGFIKPWSYVEVAFRHREISPDNYDVDDKFRVELFCEKKGIILGKRDFTATLLATNPNPKSSSIEDAERFQQLIPSSRPHGRAQQYSIGVRQSAGGTGPNIVIVLAAIFCIGALMLPTEGLDDSSLPSYLHISVNQKLVLSFTLGLVAMVILRS